MAVHSAGILLYRGHGPGREVFLVHPGGPFWARKEEGAWSVPKGIVDPKEDALAAARREFKEETGFEVAGEFQDLGIFRQPSGKRLHVWALEGDCDPSKLASNTFEIAWPPKSGRMQSFPEIDRGAWMKPVEALAMIVRGQRPMLERFFSDLAPPA
jgi:predicted NUDIX family NTP pyrophosphohydrolase